MGWGRVCGSAWPQGRRQRAAATSAPAGPPPHEPSPHLCTFPRPCPAPPRQALVLDDEDYDLLEDAGVAVARPVKLLRRFKKAGEMGAGGGGGGGPDTAARLRAELFGSEGEESDGEGGRRGRELEDELEEEEGPGAAAAGAARRQQQRQQQQRQPRDEFADEEVRRRLDALRRPASLQRARGWRRPLLTAALVRCAGGPPPPRQPSPCPLAPPTPHLPTNPHAHPPK